MTPVEVPARTIIAPNGAKVTTSKATRYVAVLYWTDEEAGDTQAFAKVLFGSTTLDAVNQRVDNFYRTVGDHIDTVTATLVYDMVKDEVVKQRTIAHPSHTFQK